MLIPKPEDTKVAGMSIRVRGPGRFIIADSVESTTFSGAETQGFPLTLASITSRPAIACGILFAAYVAAIS